MHAETHTLIPNKTIFLLMIRGRLKGAIALGLLWTAIASASYFFPESQLYAPGVFLLLLLVSLLMAVFGVVTYLGESLFIAGFNTMTERERSKYDMRRITLFMGVLCALMSYSLFLIFLSWIVFTVAILVLCVMMIVPFYTGGRFMMK